MSKTQIPDEDLVAWRRQRLCAAGFAVGLADEVSRECGMDLHALLGLVDRGCPPDLAVRIPPRSTRSVGRAEPRC